MSDYTPDELHEHAAVGAAMLDRAVPGWAERINLDALDMSVGEPGFYGKAADCGCILSQLYGTYNAGRVALDVDLDAGDRFGFISDFTAGYSALDAAWTKLVKART